METRKNLLLVLGEWWEARRAPVSDTSAMPPARRWIGLRRLGQSCAGCCCACSPPRR